jgi:hypothetical protein
MLYVSCLMLRLKLLVLSTDLLLVPCLILILQVLLRIEY